MFCSEIRIGTLIRSRSFLVSVLFFISGIIIPQSKLKSTRYYFDDRCTEAYMAILNFRFDDANILLRQEQELHPENLIPVFLANYIDFFKLFTNEEKVMFESLKSNKSVRLSELEHGDSDSPYYRFCMAGVNLQWAFVRLKFGEYITAAFEIRRAYGLLKENERLFPDFRPNKVGLGILHIMVGLVPDEYRWLADLAGLEGTIQEGISELRGLLDYSADDPEILLFRPEVCFYLAFVDINILNNPEESLLLVRRFNSDSTLRGYARSPLVVYANASILMKNGKNKEVITLLDTYKPDSRSYHFTFLLYLQGLAHLNRLDSSAETFMLQFLENFRGINYIKSAYQKLSWIYLLQGDTVGYFKTIGFAGKKGNAIVDEDKQAFSEFHVGVSPALPLLKSRLLCDGGYYQDALNILLNTPLEKYIRSKKDLTEYFYRLGRIYHAMGNLPKAEKYYSMTVRNGRNLPHYYAASAALNLGWIYEAQGNYHAADTNFRLSATLRYDEYENSLRQKAKAGSGRIRSKIQN